MKSALKKKPFTEGTLFHTFGKKTSLEKTALEKTFIKKASSRKASPSRKAFLTFNYLLMVVVCLSCVLPFVHLLAVSLSGRSAVAAGKVTFFPIDFTLSSYEYALVKGDFLHALVNSLARTFLGTMVNLTLMVITAYPLSKGRDRLLGRNLYMAYFVFTMLFSGGLIPGYLLITQQLHLTNSFWALILPGLATPYNIFIMRNFFLSVPNSLEESARIDGAGYTRIFWQIIMPLSKPVLVTVGLWIAVGHWQAWYDNLLYLQKPDKWGLQMILRELLVNNQQSNITQTVKNTFGTAGAVDERQLKSAVIVISILPMVILYPFLQKFMNKGIIIGAVKG